MTRLLNFIEGLGASTTGSLERLGLVARFFVSLLRVVLPTLKRTDLHIKQVYFAGVR